MTGKPPDEEQIERLLSGLQPEPGERFHKRMRSAPWMKAAAGRSSARASLLSWFAPRRLVFLVLLLALVFVGGGLSFPALQATAQRFAAYFSVQASDTQRLHITPSAALQIGEGYEASFPLNLDQARSVVKFPLKIPGSLPPGMSFTGAHYNSDLESITLRYASPEQTLLLTERQTGSVEEYSNIGASAPVQKVQINGITGEYVNGGWRAAPATYSPETTTTPGIAGNISVYWDAGLPQNILRWLDGQVIFEILSTGGAGLTKEDLLKIAESLR